MSRIVGLTFKVEKPKETDQKASEKMKLDDLHKLAADLGLDVPASVAKKELVALILEAQAAGTDEGEGEE